MCYRRIYNIHINSQISSMHICRFLLLCYIVVCSTCLCAQTADLIIQKSGPTSVKEGLAMSYTIKISNNGPTAVTNATFNDTFPTGVTNVTFGSCQSAGGAVCPISSNYSISSVGFPSKFNFKGTIPSLPVNSSVTFIINLNAPTFTNASSFSNTATVKEPTGITDPDLSTNSSTWNTVLIDTVPVNPTYINGDIAVFKTVNDTRGYDCTQYPKTYKYSVKWINKGPIDFHNVYVIDNLSSTNTTLSGFEYPWQITDTVWKSSPGSNLIPGFISVDTGRHRPISGRNVGIQSHTKLLPVFQKGDTITFSYTFTIFKPKGPPCGGSISWDLLNEAYINFPIYPFSLEIDSFPANNESDVISRVMTCTAPRTDFTNNNVSVKVIKTVDDTASFTIDSIPKSLNYTVKWINNGINNITNMDINDGLSSVILSSSGYGSATFLYPWTISNVNWRISPGSSFTQIIPFNLSGTFSLNNDISLCQAVIPLLEKGDTLSLTYTFTLGKPIITGAGYNVKWKLVNGANYSYSGCNPLSGGGAIGNVIFAYSPEIKKTDLKVATSVDNVQSYVCQKETKIFKYKVQWVNGGPTDVENAQISDYVSTTSIYSSISYQWNISDIVWSASSSVSIPTDTFSATSGIIRGSINCFYPFLCPVASVYSKILKFKVGDTITLSYTFTLKPPVEIGCGGVLYWQLANEARIPWYNNTYIVDTFQTNNYSSVSNNFTEISTDLVISTSVNPAIVDDGDILTISNEFYNAANAYAKPAIWFDTLPATFRINMNSIVCTRINGTSGCGRITYDSITHILRQEIDSMPANSGVKVTFNGTVNSIYTVTEYNKAIAYNSCLDCVPATNFTQSNYQINGECDSVFAGFDHDTLVAYNSRDTIRLFNLLQGKPANGGTWTRITGSGGIFSSDSAWFILTATADSSVFRYSLPGNPPCPPDTAYVTIRIQEKLAPDTIHVFTFTKDTITTCEFLPNNTNNLSVQTCDSTTSGSSNIGFWQINSVTKCLEYTSNSIKQSDTLCIRVCDTITKTCADYILIIKTNGVPPIANDDSTDTTVNTPVTINVLNNDISNDNDSIRFCNPEISVPSKHGTIIVNNDGTITYTPNNEFEGIDSIQYIICDIEGNDTAWIIIRVACTKEDACCVIPNAFSPNNDGINDIFRARCNCKLSEFYLVVYDRWGNKIFESRDVNVGWNGFQKNKLAQVEAYGYYLEYKSECSTQKVFNKGNVTLLE